MKDNQTKTTKLQKIKKWLSLHDHKRTIEIITSCISIVAMITAISYNITNVKNQNKKEAASLLTSTPIQVIVENPTSTNSGNINTPPPKTSPAASPTTTSCKKDIGEVQILSPLEGEIITDNNFCIKISADKDYCPISWAYKLDNDNWSDFTNDDSLCLYNLNSGKKNLQIKIKSTVADKSATLQRTFTYQPSSTPTISPTTTP